VASISQLGTPWLCRPLDTPSESKGRRETSFPAAGGMSIPKTCSSGWSGARLSVGLSQDLPHTPPLCIPALKLSMSQSSGLGNSLILCSFVPSSWCCSSAGGFGECHGGLRERMRPSQPWVRDSQSILLLWRGCRQTDRQTDRSGPSHLIALLTLGAGQGGKEL